MKPAVRTILLLCVLLTIVVNVALVLIKSLEPCWVRGCKISIERRQGIKTSPLCRMFQSASLAGPISNATAAEVVANMTAFRATTSNCPVFMTHFTQPLIVWKPLKKKTLKSYDSVRPCRKPPKANGACDALFNNASDRLIATRHIYNHQHPANCNSSRFLIITRQWHGGLGSTIHINAFMLLRALQTGRILIESNDIKWGLTNPSSCSQQNWSCYFAPLTNCTLPDDVWNKLNRTLDGLNDPRVQYVAHEAFPPSNEHNFDEPCFLAGLNYPEGWWFTHTSVYLVRPSSRTISAACAAWNCIFPMEPLRPFASVFVRRGDKWKEAKSHSVSEYLLKIRELQNMTQLQSIYIGTDDASILHDFHTSLNSSISWIGYHRDKGGLTQEEVWSRYHSAKAEWQVLLSLVDLLFTASADVMVGTLTSNWCRLANEMRKVHGDLNIPYNSLDAMDVGPWR